MTSAGTEIIEGGSDTDIILEDAAEESQKLRPRTILDVLFESAPWRLLITAGAGLIYCIFNPSITNFSGSTFGTPFLIFSLIMLVISIIVNRKYAQGEGQLKAVPIAHILLYVLWLISFVLGFLATAVIFAGKWASQRSR